MEPTISLTIQELLGFRKQMAVRVIPAPWPICLVALQLVVDFNYFIHQRVRIFFTAASHMIQWSILSKKIQVTQKKMLNGY